jgi:hypothetical protein
LIRLAAAALIGVLHVHHEPSHDSDASFPTLLAAAHDARLDFLVLTEHVPQDAEGELPGATRAGVYLAPDGHRLRILVGGEFGTRDGHLLGYQISHTLVPRDRTARQAIDEIHAMGGFAVVPHPFHYGGWKAWDAPFDGLEVHNNAVVLRSALNPLLPLRLLQLALSRDWALRSLTRRPDRALARWDALRRSGRRIVAFSGADAHQNVSLLGWQIDPYQEAFRGVQMVCPDGPLEPTWIWAALREARCSIRYAIHERRAHQAREVRFETGRIELQLDGGTRVLEIRQFGD